MVLECSFCSKNGPPTKPWQQQMITAVTAVIIFPILIDNSFSTHLYVSIWSKTSSHKYCLCVDVSTLHMTVLWLQFLYGCFSTIREYCGHNMVGNTSEYSSETGSSSLEKSDFLYKKSRYVLFFENYSDFREQVTMFSW